MLRSYCNCDCSINCTHAIVCPVDCTDQCDCATYYTDYCVVPCTLVTVSPCTVYEESRVDRLLFLVLNYTNYCVCPLYVLHGFLCLSSILHGLLCLSSILHGLLCPPLYSNYCVSIYSTVYDESHVDWLLCLVLNHTNYCVCPVHYRDYCVYPCTLIAVSSYLCGKPIINYSGRGKDKHSELEQLPLAGRCYGTAELLWHFLIRRWFE